MKDTSDQEGSDPLYPTINVNGRELDRREVLPDNIAHKIKGKTLQIYYFLVTHRGKFGVREIAREFDYSSASLASYHLDRLYDYDLVQKTETGKYFVEGDPVKLGRLRDKIEFAGVFVPKILMFGYHGIFSIIIAIILWLRSADPLIWFLYILISNIIFLAYVIYESIKSADIEPEE